MVGMTVKQAAVLLSRSERHVSRWVQALRLGHKKLRRVSNVAGRVALIDLADADIEVLRRAIAGHVGTLEQARYATELTAGALVPVSPWKRARWHGR